MLIGPYLPELWDLHPDGNRIVVAQAAGLGEDAEAGRFLVVVNWLEELERRVRGQ